MIVQKSLCIFMHYSKHLYIPIYVSMYVNELSFHFEQVILVTNYRSINKEFLSMNQNVTTLFVKNEGYDFGMFYKAFQTIIPSEYSQIACINDSNILINGLNSIFDWGKSTQYDFWGIIDSHEKPWFSTHTNNYHIQSHFMVFNRKAIDKIPAFFASLSIQEIFNENDPVKLRQAVINQWEIGLTQYLVKQGFSCGSFIDSKLYTQLYLLGKSVNAGHKLYAELIQAGYPLMKRKIIIKKSWKDRFRQQYRWEKIIRQYGNKNWDIENLIDELKQIKKESSKT